MLEAACLSVSFGKKFLFRDLSLQVPDGSILSIIGPNGSGKSTLLKVLSRTIQPEHGAVLLDGKQLQSYALTEIARQMAVLPQTPAVPGDLTVYDLVSYGRFPHQSWWKNTRHADDDAVEWALGKMRLRQLKTRLVSTLSGGERQRVWLALALAQKPRVLLLDEPTTYLDIAHQLEVLELVCQLNSSEGITVIMVLHDMNHAARYSNRIAVLNKGSLYALGTPQDVMNETMLREVFGVTADIYRDEEQRPICVARCLANQEENDD